MFEFRTHFRYSSNMRSSSYSTEGLEGTHMMPIEMIPRPAPTRGQPARVRPVGRFDRPGPRGPQPSRPVAARPRYRGTGVLVSTAPHRPRPITPATTVGLALIAAMITVWLGLVAHFGDLLHGSSDQTAAQMPDRLAVVRVEPGESLQHLAARVAPDAPTGRVAARIRELNDLDSAAVMAGQTLIAPVG
jgi:hypothetical protein